MILLPLIFLTIFLKALEEGLTYRSWTTRLSSKWNHWVKLLLIFSAFLTGAFFGAEIFTLRFLFLFLSTAFIYAGCFDFTYGKITGNWAKNESLVWDRLRIKYPIMDKLYFRIALILIGLFLFTKTNI